MFKDKITSEINPYKGFLYIRIVLFIAIVILLLYTYINLVLLGRQSIAIVSFITACLVSFDLIYIIVKKELFLNLFISILTFSLLCVIIPILRADGVSIGRMWVLLLPGIYFYTQTIKRSLIMVLSMIITLIITNIFIVKSENALDHTLNFEQILVFSFISVIVYLYALAVERQKLELKQQHLHNLLTGLPNRKKLHEDLDSDEYRVLALINIDGFNNINNIYGAKVGDEVLLVISERLKMFIDDYKDYRLYKLHADEYAICVFNSKGLNKDIKILSQLTHSITDVIVIDKHEIYPSISIGVGHGYNNIIQDSDMALQSAKSSRKNLVVYDKNIGVEDKFKSDLLTIFHIRNALKEDGIIPYFQPIINIKTGFIDKYEALVRLEYDGKIISPGKFLNISKKIKVYNKISKIVIDKTFEYFSKNPAQFSINLDADDLMSSETTNYIFQQIDRYNNGSMITFEILESQAIDNPVKVMGFILEVKKLGCKIAIDDFGSGYSNFDYLIKFKIDFLKIDSSLIKNIDTDRNSYIMTKSIVTFAKQLGIKTVAEHIDKESIYNIIEDLGIDYGQGYYWSNPKPHT